MAEPEPRVPLPLRVRPSALRLLDGIAAAERRSRSDMARLLLQDGIDRWRKLHGEPSTPTPERTTP